MAAQDAKEKERVATAARETAARRTTKLTSADDVCGTRTHIRKQLSSVEWSSELHTEDSYSALAYT